MTTWLRNDEPTWYPVCPGYYDIVSCWWPDDPKQDLRPCLVVGKATNKLGQHMVRVQYGTTKLKPDTRAHWDLLITDPAAIRQFGLHLPTRFDLDAKSQLDLTYNDSVFGCAVSKTSPVIGTLNQDYIEEVKRKRALRSSPQP